MVENLFLCERRETEDNEKSEARILDITRAMVGCQGQEITRIW